MRFIGTINAKLDAKGRVFLPAAFRRILPEDTVELVLRRDVYQPCLVIYPLSVWEEEIGELRQRLNRWNPRDAMIFRQFMSEAETLTLDGTGRILLSRRMLQQAAIEKELVFVGMDDRIEVWSRERMETPFLDSGSLGASLQALMSPE